jgi:hypothetical protein
MTGADTCAVVGLPGRASRCSNNRRSKKVGLLVLFCCVVPPTIDDRTSTPTKEQAIVVCLLTTSTSTSGTSASRGYCVLGVHTDLYSSHNIRTLTTLRLRGGGGGFQPIGSYFWLLHHSHRVRFPRCDCRRMLNCVWAGTTVGLPTHQC